MCGRPFRHFSHLQATYQKLLPLYFPRSLEEEVQSLPYLPADIGNAEGEPVVPERQIRITEKPGLPDGELGTGLWDKYLSVRKSVGKTEKEGERCFMTSIHLSHVIMIPVLKLPPCLFVFPSSNCSRAGLSFPFLVEEAGSSFPL